MSKQFMKIEDAAEFIQVSPWTIRKWIREGRLKSHRFGGAIRIKETDLLSFAEVPHDKKIILK